MNAPTRHATVTGCHGEPSNPRVSRHRTLEQAVQKARTSDRLQVERSDRAGCVWGAPARNHPQLGAGRYGLGPQPGEPSLPECVEAAYEAIEETR